MSAGDPSIREVGGGERQAPLPCDHSPLCSGGCWRVIQRSRRSVVVSGCHRYPQITDCYASEGAAGWSKGQGGQWCWAEDTGRRQQGWWLSDRLQGAVASTGGQWKAGQNFPTKHPIGWGPAQTTERPQYYTSFQYRTRALSEIAVDSGFGTHCNCKLSWKYAFSKLPVGLHLYLK